MAAGPAVLEHLHFGLDTLTDLLQHANTTCNTPLLSNILLLLCTTLTPQQQQQQFAGSGGGSQAVAALLPAAALGRLAAAAAAVLPSVTPEEAAAASASLGNSGSRVDLQPTPELQQSYEFACRWVDGPPVRNRMPAVCVGLSDLTRLLAATTMGTNGSKPGTPQDHTHVSV